MSRINELIERLADKRQKVYADLARVISVDKEAFTCDVALLNEEPDLYDVALNVEHSEQGVVAFPVVDSIVVVNYLNRDVAFVALTSEVKSVQIHGKQYGGLIKIEELRKELNKTNAVVNALVNSLKSFTPVSGDGGAALKIFATSQLTGKQVGSWDTIENEEVKHG